LGLGYRAPYLLKLARDVAAGRTDLEPLRDRALPTPELRKRLIALPGIGPYAAAALLALLGRHDFIPVDTEAVSAVSKFFYGGRKVGANEINAVFAHWGEHKALAYWFWDYEGES
jgi:3-methyladenine DNA glycosylase/8-oxoguanine DNA glycosylase